jgi:hypothetical protein
MKLDKELETNFIKAIQKHGIDRSKLEDKQVWKRNKSVEEQFKKTPKVLEKLDVINEKLRQEEKRIFYQYRSIEKQCKQMVMNKEIDDYNIEIVTNLWNDAYYKRHDPEVEGNPFYDMSFVDFMNWQEGEEYNPASHNPFYGVEYCRTFYCLVFHCHDLTWFDLYNIDEVWMEIKVDYQFTFKVQQ